ncbi:MAG: cupin domain-containing protein [Gammaproteobacteria bacterium]|nr:cupin domain-containing protein [Gammaproteobacteria bacterium]
MSIPTPSRAAPLPSRAHRLLLASAALILSFAAGTAAPPAPAQAPPQAQAQGEVRPLSAVRFEQDEDVKCLASALETGDAASGPSTFILQAPPGCVVPWHYHSAVEQAVVIRGAVKMEMTGHGAVTLAAGGFAMMPSRAAHQFSCVGATACLLTVAFDRKYDIFWVAKKP